MVDSTKKISSNLQVVTETLNFEWKVKGFNKIPLKYDHPIPSPAFSLGDKSDESWQMRFTKIEKNPSSKSDRKIKSIGFVLTKLDESSFWETVNYQVIIEYGGKVFRTDRRKTVIPYDFQSYSYLYESELGENFFDEDEICIKAELELVLADLCPLIPSSDLNRLNKDLLAIFYSKAHTDIILLADGTEILAHKNILAGKGYQFDCNLQEDADYKKSKVEVDMDSTVCHALLVYVYCDGLPQDFPIQKFPTLVKVAEKFDIAGLQELVRKYLDGNLRVLVCPKCLKASNTESASEVFLRLPQARIEELVKGDNCTHSKSG